MIIPRKKSFTVMEIVVASTLLVVFSLILVAGLAQNYETFQTSNIINTFQNDARLSIYKIRKDLRRTDLSRITITKNTPSAGTDRIVYRLPQVDLNNDPVVSAGTLQWSSDNITLEVDNGNLTRTDSTETTILAKNVKAITFIDVTQSSALYLNEIKIGLEFESQGYMGRIHNYKTVAIVNMRN